jgi:hypothetical protein
MPVKRIDHVDLAVPNGLRIEVAYFPPEHQQG